MPFNFKLRDLFGSAKDKLAQVETKTFVRIFSETGIAFAEVKDRDVAKLTLPEGAHHFTYFDRKIKKGEELNTRTLYTDPINVSPTYLVFDRVMTMKDFNAMPVEEKEKLTSSTLSFDNNAAAHVGILGNEVRYLSEGDSKVVALEKQTLRQLWPVPADAPKSNLNQRPIPEGSSRPPRRS